MPLIRHGVLTQLLGLLPRRMLAVLDAWSYGVARRRAEARRKRGS
jgi:hypothetical protein